MAESFAKTSGVIKWRICQNWIEKHMSNVDILN